MKKYFLYLKPIHPAAYRHIISGQEICGAITGLYNVRPDDSEKVRLCYEVTYLDNFVDYIPVSDVEDGSYKIIE